MGVPSRTSAPTPVLDQTYIAFRSSSGRCAPSRHPTEGHPQVLIIALAVMYTSSARVDVVVYPLRVDFVCSLITTRPMTAPLSDSETVVFGAVVAEMLVPPTVRPVSWVLFVPDGVPAAEPVDVEVVETADAVISPVSRLSPATDVVDRAVRLVAEPIDWDVVVTAPVLTMLLFTAATLLLWVTPAVVVHPTELAAVAPEVTPP